MANNTITLQHLINMHTFDGLRLIAGKGGLNNEVLSCCILDYEYDPDLKNKFAYTNFLPGHFLFTSLMYAKDREYLIGDSIRMMIQSGISGLAIKNVYHLPLPESALRYADSKNFPIFIFEDLHIFVEPLLRSMTGAINLLNDFHKHRELINAILRHPLSENEEIRRAYEFFPIMRHYYMAVYFLQDQEADLNTMMGVGSRIRDYHNAIIYRYGKGALLLCNAEVPEVDDTLDRFSDIIELLRASFPRSAMGVSNIHYSPSELRFAIEECIHASLVMGGTGTMRYSDMGSYQVLFGAAREVQARSFSQRILTPVLDYDIQNGSSLEKTLFGLVECEGNLHQLAAILNQHENTLRQRLSRIAAITGLDFRKLDEYGQLAMAVRLNKCEKWLNDFEA